MTVLIIVGVLFVLWNTVGALTAVSERRSPGRDAAAARRVKADLAAGRTPSQRDLDAQERDAEQAWRAFDGERAENRRRGL
jgi:hypothetical protein